MDMLALMVKLPISTMHDSIQSTASAIGPILQERFIGPPPTMTELSGELKDQPFPDVAFVVDVIFLPSHAPLGTFPVAKEWYSVKHQGYGVKY